MLAIAPEPKTHGHVPVLLAEVLEALKPEDGAVYVDGTFGGGGYARAILEASNCTLYAIDRDPRALAAGRDLADAFDGRLALIEGRFGAMAELLAARGVSAVDGVVLDVGVSSMQLEEGSRGFSFLHDGPLDMRMGGEGPSAAEAVNGLDERMLADVLFHLGEERKARRIAKAIALARAEKPITRTVELAALVERAAGGRRAHDRIHPATRTFQALRILVNDELRELAWGLAAAERLLVPGGRVVAVSFHSLEDRIVKRFLAERSGRTPRGSRHAPETGSVEPSFRMLRSGAVTPSEAEQRMNPRARSARLRAAERTGAPAIPLDLARLGVPEVAPGREPC